MTENGAKHPPAKQSWLRSAISHRRAVIMASFVVFIIGACLFVLTQIMWIQIIGLVIGIPAFLIFIAMTFLYEALFALRFTSARGDEYPDDFTRNNGRYLPPGS